MMEKKYGYVAKDLDGKIYATCADHPAIRKDLAIFLAEWAEEGATIERLPIEECRIAANWTFTGPRLPEGERSG